MNARILIVDDVPDQVKGLAQALEHEGYQVEIAEDDAEALYLLDEFQPDLIILDIRFGYDERKGLDICKEIREQRNDKTTRIIMLTGVDDDDLEPKSLDCAQDYVRKNRPTAAILARVKKRLPRSMREVVTIDDHIEIDQGNRSIRVKRNGEWESVHFAPKEETILMKLIDNPGHVLPRETLERFFPNSDNPSAVLNAFISKLRSKIEPDPSNPQYILLKSGEGYYFKDYR